MQLSTAYYVKEKVMRYTWQGGDRVRHPNILLAGMKINHERKYYNGVSYNPNLP
jgi:hypothetical protein